MTGSPRRRHAGLVRQAWLLTLFTLVPGASTQAQDVTLTIEGGGIADEAGKTRTGGTVAPEVHWAGEAGSLRLRASGTVLGDGAIFGGGGAEAEARVARMGPLTLSVQGGGAGVASEAGYRAASIEVAPGLRLGRRGAAVEGRILLRGAGEAHPQSHSWQGFLTGAGAARGGAMQWRQAVGGEVGVHLIDRVWEGSVRWSRTELLAASSPAWTELTALLAVDVGGVRTVASLGGRRGPGAEEWASVSLAVPLGAATRLTGGLGRAPADPLTGRAGGRFATVGVQLGLRGRAASRAELARPRPVPAGTVRFELRAEPGATVELLGDWDDWSPLRVTEESPGHFAREILLQPGVYRFAFRVDGRWTLPPGQEAEESEYGGQRAVLRVGMQ